MKERRDGVFHIKKMLSDYHLGVGSAHSSSTKSDDVKEKQNPSNPQMQLAASSPLPIITNLVPLIPNKASIIKKFKPKYSPLELRKSPLRHASVVITKATAPKFIYVQIEDEDKPLYRDMLIELEKEFHSASTFTSTYCPSPVIGNLSIDY